MLTLTIQLVYLLTGIVKKIYLKEIYIKRVQLDVYFSILKYNIWVFFYKNTKLSFKLLLFMIK